MFLGERMPNTPLRCWFVGLLVPILLVAGCVGMGPEADRQTSPLAQTSPSPLPTLTSRAVPTPAATATVGEIPAPSQLVVLHTNDNWGETEPCG
jgi:hypothetical protein